MYQSHVQTVKITMCFCHDPVTITSYASYVIMSLLSFGDNLEICATNNTRMSLQSFRVDSNEILL